MERKTLVGSVAAIVGTLAVVGGYWYWRSPEATRVKVGDVAPDLSLPTLGVQEKTSLSRFRGHPVLLVMFMSGCHICEEEIGEVERLNRFYRVKGLVVLGVSADDDDAKTADFIKRHDVTFFVMRDPGALELRRSYGREDRPYRLPEAYLIDPAGRVSEIFLGSADWRGKVRNKIREFIAPDNPGQLAR